MTESKKHRIWILTLFPEYFTPLLSSSGVIARALADPSNGLDLEFRLVQIREWAGNRYGSVDDSPYGGGPGMIMRADVLQRALMEGVVTAGGYQDRSQLQVIYLSPRGKQWNGALAKEKLQSVSCSRDFWPDPSRDFPRDMVLICGRYEGVDERFIKKYVDEEISIGDYILSGGEIAAMAVLDSMLRYLPGVLGNAESAIKESFEDSLLEAPQYTRPRIFEEEEVPATLISGHHKEIAEYQLNASVGLTKQLRPDLYQRYYQQQNKAEIKTSPKTSPKISPRIYLGLVHGPVKNKLGEEVTTSVTNLDVHDIARSCRTYGVSAFFIITPVWAQQQLLERMLGYWKSDSANLYNPDRHDALSLVRLSNSVEEVLRQIDHHNDHQKVKVAVTSATTSGSMAAKMRTDQQLLQELATDGSSMLLLFGTGYGLAPSLFQSADYCLTPIYGAAEDNYNHLSVRSAVAIYFERLFGAAQSGVFLPK
ncbi:MAG: tRNA (guanosine(37)-N1)-methyltransferase TrmD [Oligoflexia bacterium]|nr:tRNA (guanosine(37)-N1)-methyltransferase TrmD [Oligoflexia bacterium]